MFTWMGYSHELQFSENSISSRHYVIFFEICFLYDKHSCLEKRSDSVEFILQLYNTVEICFRNSVQIIFQFFM